MARRTRIDYPGAWHHVMNRGARRAEIFVTDDHCRLFLEVLAETVERSAIEVNAYSLMPNHYHLLVRSVLGNLSEAMKHLSGTYTQRLNQECGWDGPLFRGRFRSRVVEKEEYERHLFAYLHLNPVRARLVRRPDQECWTSHRAFVGLDAAPPWLSFGEVRRVFGSGAGLDAFVRAVYCGAEPWPTGFDEEVDFFTRKRSAVPVPTGSHANRDEAAAGPPESGISTETLLYRIASIAGASIDELRSPSHGRGANPARRFAVLALRTIPTLTSRDVAGLLDMSPGQVRLVAHRGCRPGDEQIRDWLEAWSDTSKPNTTLGDTESEI